MKPIDRRTFLRYAAGALAALATPRVLAQTAPELKSIQIVVPTPPGTQPDVIARWITEPMARRAGLPGTVLNRPGAAGAIAADAVLAAPPSTGALLLGGLDHVAYSHLTNNRRALDPFVDFNPVGAINRDTWVIATSAEGPVRTLADLVGAARAQGSFNYGSAGEGTTAHLLSERLRKGLGIEAQHVPYKESYIPDLVAGRLQFVVAPTPALLGPLRAGRVRALASLTDERITVIEGVPSIRELGHAEQVFYGGLFLFAPSSLGTHGERINTWLVETLRQPDVISRYRDAAIEPTPLGLKDVRRSVRDRLRTVDAMRLAVFGRTG